MGILARTQSKHDGFTIVELIVVITVISILAGIVLVAYPGYQQRMRDNERKSDLSQLAAALNAYALQNNDYIGAGSGCGSSGNGNGWVARANGGAYTKSIAQCLEEAGVLDAADDMIDPSGCTWDSGGACGSANGNPTTAYLKAVCEKDGKPVVYVMGRLESEPRRDAEIDALCDPGTFPGYTVTTQKWGTMFGVNHYVSVK